MTTSKYIAGAGGGGGGGGKGGGGNTPSEADDTLQSNQFANVLDLLSEGEIHGLEEGSKSIFLDDTPLQAADGSYNFQGFNVYTRTGTQNQTYIPGVFGNVEAETPVGIQVENGTPVIRSITDSNVDRVRVSISIPSLRKVEDDGDIVGTSVSLSIQVQYNGGGYSTVRTDVISGKSSSNYQRDYLLTLSGQFPVDIKVVRNTADSSSVTLENSTFWQSYTEIIDAKLRYPNSALVGLRIDSSQFSGIPKRKYLIRGIKVQIPSNATVDTVTYPGRITYSGVWNGTFKSSPEWTCDPAWCLWDLLTNERYGCGIPEASLDRYDFFSISQYCNELVSDGKGQLETRFNCNLLINQRKVVYNVIQEMSSIFRGISYYGAGSLVLQQDKPSDAQYALGPANVIDGVFSYSGSSLRSRHTTATVAYQNYDDLGEVAFEYVEDADAVAKYGINNKDIKAVGCYSQGQANRIGKWSLLSEQDLHETCSFGVGLDSGIALRPGMVVDIADPLRGGTRRNGRVSSSTTTVVTVDSSTNLSVNMSNSPTLSVILPTGLVETRSISSISGRAVTVSSAFSEAPASNAPWLIQTSDIQSQQFRVVSVADAEDGTLGVTAIKYNESIYAAVERDLNLTQRDISNLNEQPNAVEGLDGQEYLYQEGQTVHTGFSLSWVHDRKFLQDFVVKYKLDDDNAVSITTSDPSVTLTALRAGVLEVQVVARNFYKRQSSVASATFQLTGKTAPPADVQNLSIEPISSNSARLRWDRTTDLDVKVNGLVHIKHSNLTDGSATWPNSTDLIVAVPGNSTEAIVPLVAGEIFAKFEDDLGNKSVNATSVLVQLPETFERLVIETRREDSDTPKFQGNYDKCFRDDTLQALILDSDSKIDTVSSFDSISSFVTAGNLETSGEYEFSRTLDLGGSYGVHIERHLATAAFFPDDLVDSRTALVDSWTDFDGGDADSVNAKLYLRSTSDAPSPSATYGAWQEVVSGTFQGRAFQFKAELSTSDAAQNIQVNQLGYRALFQQRQENSDGVIASGTSTKSVAFGKGFFTGNSATGGENTHLPSVAVTVHNLGDGERLNVSNVSATGFDVDILDSSDSNVDRNFTYAAVGYGKAV